MKKQHRKSLPIVKKIYLNILQTIINNQKSVHSTNIKKAISKITYLNK